MLLPNYKSRLKLAIFELHNIVATTTSKYLTFPLTSPLISGIAMDIEPIEPISCHSY